MRVVRTRRGARLMHGGHVVSEVLARPGPTHSIFDVLAAGLVSLRPQATQMAMLGFAGGGVLAPLRAMGATCGVEAVDLSLHAAPLFQRLCGRWAGAVRLFEDDALRWLGGQGRRYPVVLEDLSAQLPGDVTKPPVCLNELPQAISDQLAEDGVVVVNALPVEGHTWAALIDRLTRPYPRVQAVSIAGYDNRVLLCGDALPAPQQSSRRMRRALEGIGSRLSSALRVRQIR